MKINVINKTHIHTGCSSTIRVTKLRRGCMQCLSCTLHCDLFYKAAWPFQQKELASLKYTVSTLVAVDILESESSVAANYTKSATSISYQSKNIQYKLRGAATAALLTPTYTLRIVYRR